MNGRSWGCGAVGAGISGGAAGGEGRGDRAGAGDAADARSIAYFARCWRRSWRIFGLRMSGAV